MTTAPPSSLPDRSARVLAARVRRGAVLLDQVEPGWHRRIAVDRLAMETCDQCILGQLHGDFLAGFRRVLASLPSRHRYSAAEHGFTLHDHEQWMNWKQVGPGLVAMPCPVTLSGFAALAEAWRAEVRAREAGYP